MSYQYAGQEVAEGGVVSDNPAMLYFFRGVILGCLCLLPFCTQVLAEPQDDPVMDRPTLHSLGMYWMIKGDDNRDGKVEVEYRKAGATTWQAGYPLFRVETEGQRKADKNAKPEIPLGGRLLAGSIVMLDPGTDYEIKLTLTDEGKKIEKVLKGRTAVEPVAPKGPMRHVVPGNGGGSGTEQDPFRGLAASEAAARPGDTMLVHMGTYPGTFTIKRSGEEGKPIIYRAAGDGEVIIDGGAGGPRPPRAISMTGASDIWLEGLTIRNAEWGVVAHEAARLVMRRCHVKDCDYGMTATTNTTGRVIDYFITDNIMEGPCTWPRTKGIENPRGMQITGSGHVIAYNRVIGFADAIDTMPSQRCDSIDIHNNEISEMTDDGIETDYSQRNVRVFHNRLTNIFQGISTQPVYGGPIYIFRNAMYNIEVEPFKLHNSPSGALLFHNTSVKASNPFVLWTGEPLSNCVSRNNLFLGTGANHAIENTAPMRDCDFDYDGFGGGPFGPFMVWAKVTYATVEEVRAKAPAERHLTVVDPAKAFATGIRPPADVKLQQKIGHDLRLAPQSEAIDAGQVLPGFNDGFAGKGPDLGAFELGQELPHYGPRPAAR